MLPHAYEVPAAIFLLIGGVLACFAGYRLFRIVLAIYGFILGALIASSMMGISNTAGMLTAAFIGGLVGAIILVFAYFVGIAIIGAGLGALVTQLGWQQLAGVDAPAIAIVGASVAGGLVAMFLQRYVIVFATAFGGAWTTIVGALSVAGGRAARSAASAVDVWILYPLHPAPGQRWIPLMWAALGAIGTVVQLGFTARRR